MTLSYVFRGRSIVYKHILHRLPRKFVRITYESTIDKSLFIVYNMVTEI